MTPAETLIAAAERLERDAVDLSSTWERKGFPASERMERRVAIDTALASLLRGMAVHYEPLDELTSRRAADALDVARAVLRDVQ